MATMMVIAIMAMISSITMIHADDDDDDDGDDDDDDDDDVVMRKPRFLSLTDHHSAVGSARNLA